MPTIIEIDLLRSDVPNKNGRVYPRRVLEAVVQGNRAQFLPVTNDSTAFELDGLRVTPETMVGELVDLQLQGDRLIGVMRVVDNLEGQELQQLHQLDYRFSFAARGIGTVDMDGVVQDDYVLEGAAVDWGTTTQFTKIAKMFRKKMKGRYESGRTSTNR